MSPWSEHRERIRAAFPAASRAATTGSSSSAESTIAGCDGRLRASTVMPDASVDSGGVSGEMLIALPLNSSAHDFSPNVIATVGTEAGIDSRESKNARISSRTESLSPILSASPASIAIEPGKISAPNSRIVPAGMPRCSETWSTNRPYRRSMLACSLCFAAAPSGLYGCPSVLPLPASMIVVWIPACSSIPDQSRCVM